MPPSENAIVRHVDEPGWQRIPRFNARDYPLIFAVYELASNCPYLPQGFKDYLYDQRRFSDNTLYRLSARFQTAITENDARGFPDGTAPPARCLALIRWLYLHQESFKKLYCERDAVRKLLNQHKLPLTRANLLRMKIATEISLPMKGYSRRWKYYNHQVANEKLVCPICYDKDDHMKIVLESITNFHDHMTSHGQIDIYGCHKCHRIYQEKADYEIHVCKSGQPKEQEFPTVIYAIACCECGFAARYDIQDVRRAAAIMAKFKKILLNHNSQQLVVIKLATTHPKGEVEGEENMSWTGQMKLTVRRARQGGCNLPGCKGLKLEDDRAFRRHLCTHMKANRVPFIFSQFLKNYLEPTFVDVPGISLHRQFLNQYKDKTGNPTFNLTGEDAQEPEDEPVEPIIQELPHFPEYEHTESETDGEQFVGGLRPTNWIEEYKDTVPFKVRFEDPLPGVANSTSRIFLCKKCYLITFGNSATMSHIKNCQNIQELNFTKQVIFSSEYVWQLGQFNHLPNELIPCVVESCKVTLCSIQGFVVHFADKHGYVANIDYNSAGGYGSEHRESWRDRDSYLVQEVNQFCGLSKDGDLPLDTATNEAEAQYSEEILAMQEDVDLSWLEEVEPPYEFPEESDEELEPRDFYPKRATVPQNGEGIELDQPEVQVVPKEVKIYPGMEIQLEQAPMSLDTVANGLVSPDQSSGTDSMSPNESNQPKVPSLKLRLGPSLSIDVLEANGITANDDLPDDYQKRKERKDEKRRQKRERRLQSASDKAEEETRSVTLARETARMEREADGREMEKRRKKKQDELVKKAKEAEIWKRVSEDMAAGAVQEGERNAEGEGRQQTIEINFGNRCFDCGLEFNADQMKEHYRRHRFFSTRRPDTFLITCHHCLLSFKELKEFLSHVVFTHSKENPDKDSPKKRICNDCARPYTNEAFVNHSRYECYMMKKCGQCGEDMERMRHAEKTAHMNQKHRDAKRFWCNCSSGSSTGKSSFASIIDFDNHTCSVKQLAEITMSEDLLMGAKVDSAFTLGVINGSSKRAKFEAPVEKSSPALRQIQDARPPGDAAVLRKMLEAPVAVSRVRSEEPLEGERRRRKRKASEPTEAERTNTLAHQAIVASQLATSVQSTLSLEDSPLQIVEDEPSTSTAAPAGSSTAAPELPGTSAGSPQTSGILSQALKEAGIPTASTEVRSPPPADQEPGTSREKAKKEVGSPCKDVKAARPTPADAYIANMPSTSSAPVNGTDDNFSTTATIAADDDDDDEIICLDSPRPGTSTDPDVEFLAPAAPHVSAPAILNEDGDIMEVDIMETDGSVAPRPARAAKFPCDICQKAFKTRRAMHDHRDLDHHRDICSLDRHLTQNVYGIPYRGTSYLCTHCVMVFETGHRHAQHMGFHRELGTEILLCDFCSVQALSHEGMQKHLLHHGIDVRNPNRRQPIQIENWCTLCTPMLSFPSDAGYYLHVMETHHCPIFFFCKNCLVGSCDDNVIWNHIMSGRCTEKRVYERTIGFAIASDLHFQPTDEGVHLQKLRETPAEFVKPHTCTSRSFVKYHNKNATCEEVEREGDTDKCHSLINFFAFENRMCQQLNYHVADSGSIPKEQLPDHRFCNLEYNLYRWLDSKFHHTQRIPLNIESERGDQIQPSLPPPQLPYPQPPVGRGVINQQQRGQPRTTPPTRPSAGPSALVNQLSRQSSRSRSGASPARVGQTPRHSTSSASSRGPPEVVQLRPQHSVFQRITLPTVSDPESRVRHVEDQLGINSRRIAMEAQQGHQVGQLRVRQAELTAMLGRLTHQINLERQHGPRMPQFQMDVPAADVPYYAAEMIPPLAAVAPRPAAAHPLMALQLEASRQAAPQAAEELPPPPEILRPVHQNQQVVQPRPEVRRPGDTIMGTCAVCDGQLSAKFLVRLMGKTEDYVTVILTSAAHLSGVGLLTGIRQRMTRNNSVCFQHVNPHAVSVINSNTFVVSNHQQASMLTYNYVEYAYPALDKVAYTVTLQQLYAQLDSEQITHQQFINLLKAANRCRETSCKNSPLSNMSAAKLHGHHVAGLRMMGQLLCSHCWKCFSNETDIVAHMMAEHSRANQHGRVQFDLRCPVPNCAVGFDNPSNLQAHLSTQHRAMFSHTSMCNQPFATEEAKALHDATHRRCGSGRCCSLCGIGSPFEGVLCGRFNNLSHYHRHACVVRYTCKVCMEGFEKHSQLLSHCRRYHNIGGSDPLHCQFCRKKLNADEVTTHINGEHELLLFAVNQLASPQITCPPEMNEFLGLSATR